MTRSCGFRWCEQKEDNGKKYKKGKLHINEDVRTYLLLGLDAGAALRLPAPGTHLLVLFWVEKAHPLRAAHVVPAQKRSVSRVFN